MKSAFRGRLAALTALASLTACAGSPDPEQARICRRTLPTLVPAGARVTVLREGRGELQILGLGQ